MHPAEEPLAWASVPDVVGPDGFVVLNVHNGPGEPDDPYYPAPIRALGVPGLGYVDLDYAARECAAVVADVRAWGAWYGVRSVMFDQVPADPAAARAVRRYVEAARAAGAVEVVGNPGVVPDPAVAACFDEVCVFEADAAAYLAADLTLPTGFPRAWHLVHSCPPAALDAVYRRARRHRPHHLFVTDRTLPHPWGGWNLTDAGIRAPEAGLARLEVLWQTVPVASSGHGFS